MKYRRYYSGLDLSSSRMCVPPTVGAAGAAGATDVMPTASENEKKKNGQAQGLDGNKIWD